MGFVTRLTRQVQLVEQELLTLPEHMSSPPVFSGVCVTQSLVLCVCFVDRCLSFCMVSFGHCVVCPSSIYGFWLPLWYFQTLLTQNYKFYFTSLEDLGASAPNCSFIFSYTTFFRCSKYVLSSSHRVRLKRKSVVQLKCLKYN